MDCRSYSMDCRSYSSRARSSSSRHEVTSGRLRSSARRSRSVIPPQTPNSIPLSSASARHSVRTGQPRQISLARFCAAPWTNNSSGSVPLHAARVVQSVIHMCPLLLIVEHELSDGRLDGVGSPGSVRAAALPRLSVRDPATYGSPARMPRPRHGHLLDSSLGLYGIWLIVTLRVRPSSTCDLERFDYPRWRLGTRVPFCSHFSCSMQLYLSPAPPCPVQAH